MTKQKIPLGSTKQAVTQAAQPAPPPPPPATPVLVVEQTGADGNPVGEVASLLSRVSALEEACRIYEGRFDALETSLGNTASAAYDALTAAHKRLEMLESGFKVGAGGFDDKGAGVHGSIDNLKSVV